MKMPLDKKILVGFTASAIILIAAALYPFYNSEAVIKRSEAKYEFKKVRTYAIDAETGKRTTLSPSEKPPRSNIVRQNILPT